MTQCKKGPQLTAQQTHSKQSRLRERTDWFSRLVRHLTRKRSGSILLQPWSLHGADRYGS